MFLRRIWYLNTIGIYCILYYSYLVAKVFCAVVEIYIKNFMLYIKAEYKYFDIVMCKGREFYGIMLIVHRADGFETY